MATNARESVTVDDLRKLPTAELALKLLRSLSGQTQLSANNMFAGLKSTYGRNEPDIDDILVRMSDAWAWLEARGLLGPDTMNASSRRLSDRGQAVADDPHALTRLAAEDALSTELHASLRSKIRPIFDSGDYETAAFAAMKEVEVRVRTQANLDSTEIGVSMMRNAFGTSGPLADPAAAGGEQVATMELFAGAIGSFKNPASHRTVDYADATEAAEVVLLADLLMRMLDRVESRVRGASA